MSSNSGLLFLNKALQAESFSVFAKYGITEDSFVSRNDKETYKFIEEYVETNGQMPSYAMVVDSVEGFTYVPEITDKFEPLAKGILDRKMTVEFNTYFQSFDDIKKEVGGEPSELISRLTEDLSDIRMKYTNTRSIGMDIKTSTEKYLEEYNKRASGESSKSWESFMPFINNEIGGYTSGNFYVFYGQSGRGKSAIVLRELLEMAQQGARVLLWSLEMPSYEVLTRLYTMLSAKLGKTLIERDGEVTSAGFDSRRLRQGDMSEKYLESFETMLEEINEHIKGTIIVRGVDDNNFRDRSLNQLESDIENVQADVVCIDPFYYLTYEKNTSKVTGGDAQNTSVKLRRLAGTLDVVMIAMTQADDVEEKKSEIRELHIPQRSAVKKTKALMEDASTLIGIDTDYKQSRGIVGIVKGRDGGEDSMVEILFMPNYGLIEEVVIDGDAFEF